jgi:hypothetical protein
MTIEEKIIKNKLGLIKLASTLGSVSQACKAKLGIWNFEFGTWNFMLQYMVIETG